VSVETSCCHSLWVTKILRRSTLFSGLVKWAGKPSELIVSSESCPGQNLWTQHQWFGLIVTDDDRLTVVRGKNAHQLANEDVVPLSRPLFQTFSVFRFGQLSWVSSCIICHGECEHKHYMRSDSSWHKPQESVAPGATCHSSRYTHPKNGWIHRHLELSHSILT
jgi:hypothetical protein